MGGNLLIRNAKLILPEGVLHEVDILVEDGIVTRIGRGLEAPSGVEVLDVKGKIVIPGVVDEHVHMREPGLEYKDNFTNGTLDAAAGGVTTVIEMPNTIPPVENRKILLEKAKRLMSKAYIDFALYGVIHDENIDEFDEMVYAGAIGFKIFLGPTTGNIPAPSDGTLYEALLKSAKFKVPLAFHAENWNLVKYFTEKIRSTGRIDPKAHTDARPPVCEEEAIQRIALFTKKTNGISLIVHVSTREGVEILRRARSEGVNIWGETNPHYLLLTVEDYRRYGTLIKVNPPIREKEHQKALWKAVLDGIITNIGSDHAPHAEEEKKRNIWEAAAGFPGVRTLLPLMIDQALKGKIPLTKIPELLSRNPAKLFNLYPKKGTIAVGSDGDMVVIDPTTETIIRKEDFYCKHPLSPFTGWKLKGRIVYTILRGAIIAVEGKVLGGPRGQWIKYDVENQYK